jgi:hypothetical protein
MTFIDLGNLDADLHDKYIKKILKKYNKLVMNVI